MTANSSCPACGLELLDLKKVLHRPLLIFPVDRSWTARVPFASLEIAECLECGHEFVVNPDPDLLRDLYSTYYRFYPFSEAEFLNDLYRIPFESFVKDLLDAEQLSSVLEIGCNRERDLLFFSSKGLAAFGVSPDAEESPKLYRGFIEDFEPESKFELVVSRFNLEHIINLDDHFSKIHSVLEDDGKVVLQVPNKEAFQQCGINNFYVHEHIHYFSEKSLQLALSRRDLVVENFSGSGEPSLLVRARKAKSGTGLRSQIDLLEAIAGFLKSVDPQQEVFLFGAGLNLASLIYDFSLDIAKFRVVDDNPELWGRVMPGTEITVESSSVVAQSSVPLVVLLLNSQYHTEVKSRLASVNASTSFVDFVPQGSQF